MKEIFCISIRNLFLRIQSAISHWWCRYWLGAEQATSHYLNQCRPSTSTRTCGTMSTWVNRSGIYIYIYIYIYIFTIMYKLQRQTVYVVTGMLFSSSFSELWSNKANKHQNNSRVNIYFLHDITNPSMAVKRLSSHIDSVSHSLCLRSAGDVIINYTMHYGAQQLWRWRMQLSLLIIVIFMIKLIYVCVCVSSQHQQVTHLSAGTVPTLTSS